MVPTTDERFAAGTIVTAYIMNSLWQFNVQQPKELPTPYHPRLID